MKAYSVSDINRYLKNVIAGDFALHGITIAGEISNFKPHPSGHVYFTLKDSGSQLRSVMWKSDTYNGIRHRIADGQKVLVSGDITVYEAGGYYQFQARKIELAGIGDLYAEFERRKQKLREEGLFSDEHKKPIPKFPKTIGIVTARQGDALRDIVSTLKRRNPFVQPVLSPAKVQGEGAVAEVCRAIRRLEQLPVDLILVCRGGGSIEDLWTFNEEAVARCVYTCSVPVISGVGHEPDVTIIDYVADLRAPTPTGAAEMAVRPVTDIEAMLVDRHAELSGAMLSLLTHLRENTEHMGKLLSGVSPRAELENQRRLSENARERLTLSMRRIIRYERERVSLPEMTERFRLASARKLSTERERLVMSAARLEALSPLRKISSGYAYVTGRNGNAVESVTEVTPGDSLELFLRDGRIRAVAESVRKEEILPDKEKL